MNGWLQRGVHHMATVVFGGLAQEALQYVVGDTFYLRLRLAVRFCAPPTGGSEPWDLRFRAPLPAG